MKKIWLLSAVALTGILAACSTPITPELSTGTLIEAPEVASGTLAFESEYEALNGAEHLPLDIPTDIAIHILDYEGVKKFLEEGTGVLYFWFPTCPRCRNLLPELFDTLKQNQISDLYYFNPKAIRDAKKLDQVSGEILVETPTSPEYQWLLDRMDAILPVYEGLNDPAIKRIYVPFVVVMKNGEIVGHHLNTVDDHLDGKMPLTEEQKKKLRNLLMIQFLALMDGTCDIDKAESDPAC